MKNLLFFGFLILVVVFSQSIGFVVVEGFSCSPPYSTCDPLDKLPPASRVESGDPVCNTSCALTYANTNGISCTYVGGGDTLYCEDVTCSQTYCAYKYDFYDLNRKSCDYYSDGVGWGGIPSIETGVIEKYSCTGYYTEYFDQATGNYTSNCNYGSSVSGSSCSGLEFFVKEIYNGACGTTGSPPGQTCSGTPPEQTCNINLNPYGLTNITLDKGDTKQVSVEGYTNSSTEDVSFSYSGCPTGATCSSPNATQFNTTPKTASFNIITDSNTQAGTYTFTASATNSSNSCTKDVNFTININNTQPPPTPSAVASISANPLSILYNSPSILNWGYSNATSCTITPPASISSYPSDNGSVSTGNLTISKTYTISCNPIGPNSSRSVTVNVASQPAYSLIVIKSGQGTVTSNPAGISCSAGCSSQSASFLENTVVNLTASTPLGRIFAGWGGACSGTGACSVLINTSKTVFATFIIDPNFKEF